MIGNFTALNLVPLDIDSNSCNIRLGDFVTPRTVIGSDSASGDLVQAGCYGTIMAVHFSGGSHSMTVFVETENRLLAK
jgi:hypothetical protein